MTEESWEEGIIKYCPFCGNEDIEGIDYGMYCNNCEQFFVVE